MSIKTIGSADKASAQVEIRASAPRAGTDFPASTDQCGALYPSLAAMTWAAFINRRLNENLRLPEQLSHCTDLATALRVYGAYCWKAASEYQAALLNFQQIGFKLVSDVSTARMVPVKIATFQHDHTAHSSERAARDRSP